MERNQADVATQLDEVMAALRRLDERVTALEARGALAPAASPAAAPGTVAPRRAAAPSSAPVPKAAAAVEKVLDPGQITRLFSLGGRTLLVLAGAFVLRALTDSGKIPAWLGVGLGFLYAGIWIVMADRAGRAGQLLSAGFHAVSLVVIGFPLLFEATTRFHLFSPWGASVMLSALSGAALLLATRRKLPVLAWVVSLGGIATAVALMADSGRLAPGTTYLVLLGVATLWIGYVADWTALRWPVALVADLMVLLLAVRAGDPASPESPGLALLVQSGLVAVYLASFATRTLYRGRKVVPFEMIQTAAVMVVGIAVAVWVGMKTGMGQFGFGIAWAFFGVVCYAVAFVFVERRQKMKENVIFYTTVALVFLVAGTTLLLGEPLLSFTWGVMAVALSILSDRQRSGTLATHAVVYALGTGIASGLLLHGGMAVIFGSSVTWSPGGTAVVALVVLALTAALTGRVGRDQPLSRIPLVVLHLGLAVGTAGVAVAWLAPLVAGTGAAASGGALATLRTVVLVAVSLVAAVLGRDPRFVEAGWLAYPFLGITGLKMLTEDLPRGRPATLILAFACYGAALILIPRLRGKKARAPAAPPAGGGNPPNPPGQDAVRQIDAQ